MSLAPGTRLGPYEVVAPIGAGGMGEVYRARDTQLKRDVALKVLPAALATDADRLARFQREAELLAALNHPNIAHIHGLVDPDGVRALVMELVEGPTLAERIARGAIPVADALPIAQQLAQALEYAHERGIVHRDLKPANIKITPDGDVKVLDFGLAKAMAPDLATSAGDLEAANSPTITTPAMTQAGIILGTAAYMSPEQARGRPVDKRADIWAFGVVLYEMLTGRPSFPGETITDVLGAVVHKDPDWSALPPDTPRPIRRLLGRCLTKDAKQRLHDIADARLEIEEATSGTAAAGDEADALSRRRPLDALTWGLAVVSVIAIVLAAWGWLRPPPTSDPPLRASITDIEISAPLNSGVRMAISRDGSHIAVAKFVDGVSRLFVRGSSELGFRQLDGTEGAEDPSFSPDGRWLAFRQRPLGGAGQGQIKRILVTGGPVLHVADGGAPHWGTDETIVFERTDGIYRVSPSGADEVLITGDRAGNAWPHLLPDGRSLLYKKDGANGRTIVLVDMESHEVTDLELPGGNPQYLATGHIVFGHESQALMAVPFDLKTRRVTGEPTTVLPEVLVYDGGATQFAASGKGTVLYGLPGPSGIKNGELVIVDLKGNPTPVPLVRGKYRVPRFSPPDGRLIAYERDGRIWTYDRELGHETLVGGDGGGYFPATWSPDGRYVYFASDREGTLGRDMFRSRADGSLDLKPLLEREDSQYPLSTSKDGPRLLVGEVTEARGWDLLIATEGPDGVMTVSDYLHARYNELMGTISPDGGRVAYVSDESKRPEVYIRAFPSGEGQLKVSDDGGTQPRWAPNGTAVYYLREDTLVKASVRNGTIVDRQPLFDGSWTSATFGGFPVMTNWDVHPNGKAFVFVRNPQTSESALPSVPIGVVVNWFEQLKQLAPAR